MRAIKIVSAIVSLVIATPLFAQVAIGPTTVHFSGASAGAGITSRNMVRDQSGGLWHVNIDYGQSTTTNTHPLVMRRSVDGGLNWVTWPTAGGPVNTAATGLGPVAATTQFSSLTNSASLAIDDTGVLHCYYGSYNGTATAYYGGFYRRYDPYTDTLSTPVMIAAAGVGTNIRNQGRAIVLDASNTVWITGQGPTTDVERLFKSAVPYAANDTFIDLGNISTSASAQLAQLCVDITGKIHCTYYRNTGTGLYEHRIYDPAVGWQAPTTLGNITAGQDLYGNIASDYLGYVHAIFEEDTTSGTANIWKWRYRRWDPVGGWIPEVVLMDAPYASYNVLSAGGSGHFVCTMAVNENTGEVYTAYRDLSATTQGAFKFARKGLADASFIYQADISPPSTTPYDSFIPAMRGSLYPPFNNTGIFADVTWQHRPPAVGGVTFPFTWNSVRIDTNPVSITPGAPPTIGTIMPLALKSAFDPGKTYQAGFAGGTSPGIALPDLRVIPLNFDDLLNFSITPSNGIFNNMAGTLDPAGLTTITVNIPYDPFIIGYTAYCSFIVIDPNNPIGIGTIGPAIAVTLQ